mgnify:CR=1 FL=1
MKSFAIQVARFLEKEDSTLVPVRERILYPPLNQSFQDHFPASSSSLSGNYAAYVDPFASSSQPSAPPSFESVADAQFPPISPEHSTHSSSQQPQISRENVREIHHYYYPRERSSEVVFLPSRSFCAPPAQTIVNVNNALANVSRDVVETEKEKKNAAKEEESDTASRLIGGTLVAGSAIATAVAVSKLSLRTKELQRLVEKRKQFAYVTILKDSEFLTQFDYTFGELVKANQMTKASAVSGGASAFVFGSLYFFGANSGSAYFSALLLGCSSVAFAAYSYYYVRDDRNAELKTLHNLCKGIVENEDIEP